MLSELLEFINEAKENNYANIYLNYQNLSELPDELLLLTEARKLFLKRNNLKKLPSDIWKLSHLLELYLHSNSLQQLPEGIGMMVNLQSLDVSGNLLYTLTPAIGQLSCLRSLRLGSNNLSLLPAEVGCLLQLKVLDVSNNHLKELPWELFLCSSLETLVIDCNQVYHISRELVKLQNLVEFSASRNKLISLPQDLDDLKSLQSLLVDGNTALKAIPATVLKLRNLQLLGANCCNLMNEELRTKIQEQVKSVRQFCAPVLPLLEMAFRQSYFLVQSRRLLWHEIQIPTNLCKLLKLPTGHCYTCRAPYFIGCFSMSTDVATMNLKNVIRNNDPLRNNLLQSRDSLKIKFAFNCCTWNCMKQLNEDMFGP